MKIEIKFKSKQRKWICKFIQNQLFQISDYCLMVDPKSKPEITVGGINVFCFEYAELDEKGHIKK